MLKQRIITAVILAPIIVWIILSVSSHFLAWVLGIFVLLAAWEWSTLCGWRHYLARGFYLITVSLCLAVSYWEIEHHFFNILFMLTITCLWWVLACYWIWCYQNNIDKLPTSSSIKALLGLLILLPAWIALLTLHGHVHWGKEWVVFLLALIWVADSGAFFVGKRWGRTKLANRVSPSKTWEGVIGALVSSTMLALGYGLFKLMPLNTLLLFMLLCILTVISSIIGDLLESLFKRQMNMKDSGQLLPGHGGVLDRIDSLTSAAPLFVVGLLLLGNHF